MKIIEKTTIITLGLETLLDIHAINEPKIMENVMDKIGKNNKSNAKTINTPKLKPTSNIYTIIAGTVVASAYR